MNRPMPGKEIGYVVDYYGVFDHLSSALADYEDADVDDTMRSMAEEVGGLAPAAEAVSAYLARLGIADGDLTDFTAVRSAALAFGEETVRQDFDEVLGSFLTVLERVLPHEAGLEYVGRARRWALLQKRIRTLHRDAPGGSFTLRLYGRKVRAMIADHLEGPEIDQVIAPVSLSSAQFDEKVRTMPAREAAAEMGHALRFHLEERVKREDPEKYARLSERLEEILRELPGRFEEQIAAFGPLMDEARKQDEQDPRLAGLSPLEQRLYRLLDQEIAERSGIDVGQADLREVTGAVCGTAATIMAQAAYQGQHQDLAELADKIRMELFKARLRPAAGADLTGLRELAERLAAYAEENRAAFLAWSRGE
ncbi:hypothetical protein [Streptomyces sp. C8S0]|uniref:hypothetical protein n=1 Tax=Streptomyces sp. C8S0 TaxID=2585716 RepID=UPI001D042833|nr:hypothetical protein [Streptomyces sp. C8S0]